MLSMMRINNDVEQDLDKLQSQYQEMKSPGTSKSSEFYSQMQELYGKIKPSYKIDFALNTQVNCNPDVHEFSPDFIMK